MNDQGSGLESHDVEAGKVGVYHLPPGTTERDIERIIAEHAEQGWVFIMGLPDWQFLPEGGTPSPPRYHGLLFSQPKRRAP